MSEIKENILGNDIITEASDVILGAFDTQADLSVFSCKDDTCLANELCRNDCLGDGMIKWYYGYYLILDVNKQNRDLLETLYKLYNVEVSEANPIPILGEKYIFGLGYVGCHDLTFEDFTPLGRAENYYDVITEKMKEVLL
jgi:hypothetical protein